MRPRLFTAENLARLARLQTRQAGFNEAAALHRGKPDSQEVVDVG